MKTLRKIILLLAGGLCLLNFLGCEVRTSASLRTGPSFSLIGSGRLVSFRVYAPQPGHKIANPYDESSLIWSIEPSRGHSEGALVNHMDISYGTAPNGYTQAVPSNGTTGSLSAGLVYYFSVETTGAPGTGDFFYMDKAAPIRIKIPDLCYAGGMKLLRCGTNEPFREPPDLEKYVREHQTP